MFNDSIKSHHDELRLIDKRVVYIQTKPWPQKHLHNFKIVVTRYFEIVDIILRSIILNWKIIMNMVQKLFYYRDEDDRLYWKFFFCRKCENEYFSFVCVCECVVLVWKSSVISFHISNFIGIYHQVIPLSRKNTKFA